MGDYYTTDEIRQKAGELEEGPHGEELKALRLEWSGLMKDIHASLDLPLDSPEARALARRYDSIRERARPLFASDDKLFQSIGRAYRSGQYDDIPDAGHAEDHVFMERVKGAAAS